MEYRNILLNSFLLPFLNIAQHETSKFNFDKISFKACGLHDEWKERPVFFFFFFFVHACWAYVQSAIFICHVVAILCYER